MKTAEVYPVLGELRQYGGSLFEGSDFRQFIWDGGVDGLATVRNGELHLLAIHTATEGTGQFREFIRQCKGAYSFIRLWTVLNPSLRPVLMRYGFTRGHDMDRFGQMQEIWDWTKESA